MIAIRRMRWRDLCQPTSKWAYSRLHLAFWLLDCNTYVLCVEESGQPSGLSKLRIVRRGRRSPYDSVHEIIGHIFKPKRPRPDTIVQPQRYGIIEYAGITPKLLREEVSARKLIDYCRRCLPETVRDLRIVLPSDQSDAMACLQSLGYQPVRYVVCGRLAGGKAWSPSNIRPAAGIDVAQLAELVRAEVESQQAFARDFQLLPGTDWHAYVTACLHDECTRMFVAESDGSLTGYIDVRCEWPSIRHVGRRLQRALQIRFGNVGGKSKPIGIVEDIYVVPHRRRQGIGRALIQTGLSWLQMQGVDQVYASVAAGNIGSLDLFLGLGFQISRHWFRQINEGQDEIKLAR